MAVNSCQERRSYFQGLIDGSCNLPLSCSCLRLLKPSFNEVNPHCSLDVLPVLFDEASLLGQDVYNISVMPEEESPTSLQCESDITFLSFLKVSDPLKSQMPFDVDHLSCHNSIELQIQSPDSYAQSDIDKDIEKVNLETPQTGDGNLRSLKHEGATANLRKTLHRQNSLRLGGKFLQILINHCLMLLKFNPTEKAVTERVHDTPNNRWRKYKRAAPFDSRKIVLLFSILSIVGTMVLIYLTLRVRLGQISDGVVHV